MEVKRDLNLNLVRPTDPAIGTVVENRLVTDSSSPNFTRHVTIDVSGTPIEGNFDIGQAFGVVPEYEHEQDYNKLEVRSEDSKLRLYSIACPFWGENGEGSTVSTTVKRVIDEHWENERLFLGIASNYLCDAEEGDKIKVTGPTGRHFVLPDDEDLNNYQYVFFAAGTGIAPFRGMVMELLEMGIDGEVHLILGVPYSTDLLYGDLFKEYEEKHDNFHFYEAISREQKTDDGEKMYVQRRLADRWDRLGSLIHNEDTLLYICGLEGMETGIYRVLLEKECMDYFAHIPDELKTKDFSALSDRDERLDEIRPNKERFLVEVY